MSTHKAGFFGRDEMRSKAERMLGGDFARKVAEEHHHGDSAGRHEMHGMMKQRKERDGHRGHPMVHEGDRPSHGLSHDQHDLHLPERKGYARGGTVYEREMRGEHPSHKYETYNYEAQMRGEHPLHKAEGMKRGGKVCRKKYAMGGIGKLRHKEMPSDYAKLRKVKVHNY